MNAKASLLCFPWRQSISAMANANKGVLEASHVEILLKDKCVGALWQNLQGISSHLHKS